VIEGFTELLTVTFVGAEAICTFTIGDVLVAKLTVPRYTPVICGVETALYVFVQLPLPPAPPRKRLSHMIWLPSRIL
jgi:hypothetical protein